MALINKIKIRISTIIFLSSSNANQSINQKEHLKFTSEHDAYLINVGFYVNAMMTSRVLTVDI
jgi:hypothetical protein